MGIFRMTLGAIILLNLLIALMSKAFDHIHEKNNQQVQFIQVERIYDIDRSIAVMPPPLFLLVGLLFICFALIDWLSTVKHLRESC